MKGFKKFLVAGIATGAVIAGSSTFASAADLFEPAPVAENPFHGFYMGVHGGYGGGDTKGRWWAIYSIFGTGVDADGPTRYKYDRDGWLAGGQAGANYVSADGWLFGAEVSVSMADIDGGYIQRDAAETTSVKSTIDAIGLFQGKLGYASDVYAFYAQGGLALAQSEYSNYWGGKIDTDHSGWTVGAGADWMMMENVSLGLSYNYVELQKERQSAYYSALGFDVNLNRTNEAYLHMIKFNVNYHF